MKYAQSHTELIEQFLDFFLVLSPFTTSWESQRTENKKEKKPMTVLTGLLHQGSMSHTVDITDFYVYYDIFQTYGRKMCWLNKIDILRQYSDRWKQSITRSAFSNSNKDFGLLPTEAILKHKNVKYVWKSMFSYD